MTAADIVAPPAAAERTVPRLSGIDIARALALLGMFMVHLDLSSPDFGADDGPPPETGFTFGSFLSGRAMPLFVLLSGVGLTLLLRSRGGRPAGVLGRAAVLLLLGALMSGNSAGMLIILQFYALYLVVGLLAHRFGDRALLGLTLAVAAVGVVIQAWLDGGSQAAMSEQSPSFFGGFTQLADPVQYLKDLLVTGAYPLFPDGAFFLAGMWVGRLRLHRVRTAAWVAAVGAALLVLGLAIPPAAAPFRDRVTLVGVAHLLEQEVGGLTTQQLTAYAEEQGQTLADFDATLRSEYGVTLAELKPASRLPEPSAFEQKLAEGTSYTPHDHMPPWLLQAAGGGLLALGLCLLLAGWLPAAGSALVLGRYALSAYVAHWVFVVYADFTWVAAHGLATAVLLWLAFVVLAFGWSRWRTTGPVEALLRAGGWVAIKGTDAVRSRRAVRAGG